MSTLQQSHIVDLEAAKIKGGDVDDGGPPLCSDSAIEIVENNVVNNITRKDESRVSNVSECSVEILDLEPGKGETGICLGRTKRDCRICHLSMDATNQESEFSMELGCCCKDDLAAAHKQCAEAWFKIKGNKTCEVCGSVAQNVTGVPDRESTEQWNAATDAAAMARTSLPLSDARNFWQGHKFLNLLLACMVFAFVISWLFHFNVPS